MINRHDIAAVASGLDDRAEVEGVEGILGNLDIEPMQATYVAEQRALRAALLFDGWTPSEIAALGINGEHRRVRLSPQAEQMMTSLMASWLDGFVTGLHIHTEGSEDEVAGS